MSLPWYQEKAKTSATTLSIASESSIITLANQGPDNGHFLQVVTNFYPRTNIFTDIKIPQGLLQAKAKVEPVLPTVSKYVPPHLRDETSSPPPSPAPPVVNNGPRDLAKEKRQGLTQQGELGFGAKPATQASQLHHQQQQQQRQCQSTTNQADSGYGAWRQ